MPYCAQSDLQTLIGVDSLRELSDLDNTGAVDATRVTSAITTAQGMIDSYVGQRMAVPLNPVPDVIATMCAEWAVRVLRRRRYKGQPISEDQEAEKIDRDWLDKVANGTVSLGIEPNPVKASSVIDKAAQRDPSLAISLAKLGGSFI